MASTIKTKAKALVRPSWFTADARAAILFNEQSGGVSAADLDHLLQCLRAKGVSDTKVFGVEDIAVMFEHPTSADFAVVLGGDGTARSAAALAPSNAPPLILLPGGTLNILPKALYGELAWPAALDAALARGKTKRLTGGKANGEPFFIAAMFGAPTLLAGAREAARHGALMDTMRGLQNFSKRSFSQTLTGHPDKMRAAKAEAMGVLCPSFSGGIAGEDLEWVRLDAKNMLDLARVGIRALGPNWREDPAVHARRCKSGEVRGTGEIPGTLDGEARTFPSKVRITYLSRGPRVIALAHEPMQNKS